jgi:hypothetical protein
VAVLVTGMSANNSAVADCGRIRSFQGVTILKGRVCMEMHCKNPFAARISQPTRLSLGTLNEPGASLATRPLSGLSGRLRHVQATTPTLPMLTSSRAEGSGTGVRLARKP